MTIVKKSVIEDMNAGDLYFRFWGTLPAGPGVSLMEISGAQDAQKRANKQPSISFFGGGGKARRREKSEHDAVVDKLFADRRRWEVKHERYMSGIGLFSELICAEISETGSEEARQAKWNEFIKKGYRAAEFSNTVLDAKYVAIYENRARGYSRAQQEQQQEAARQAAALQEKNKAAEPIRKKLNDLLARERTKQGCVSDRQAEWDELISTPEAQWLLSLDNNKNNPTAKVFVDRGPIYKARSDQYEALITVTQEALIAELRTKKVDKSSAMPCRAVVILHHLDKVLVNPKPANQSETRSIQITHTSKSHTPKSNNVADPKISAFLDIARNLYCEPAFTPHGSGAPCRAIRALHNIGSGLAPNPG